MRYSGYHGSPGESFDRFDPNRTGTNSGYGHAKGMACFTSSIKVARHYAEGEGFIGRFVFDLENLLEVHEMERDRSIPQLISYARSFGYDGLVVRECVHAAFSPSEPSDIYFVFDVSMPKRVETLQEGPIQENPRRGRRQR